MNLFSTTSVTTVGDKLIIKGVRFLKIECTDVACDYYTRLGVSWNCLIVQIQIIHM